MEKWRSSCESPEQRKRRGAEVEYGKKEKGAKLLLGFGQVRRQESYAPLGTSWGRLRGPDAFEILNFENYDDTHEIVDTVTIAEVPRVTSNGLPLPCAIAGREIAMKGMVRIAGWKIGILSLSRPLSCVRFPGFCWFLISAGLHCCGFCWFSSSISDGKEAAMTLIFFFDLQRNRHCDGDLVVVMLPPSPGRQQGGRRAAVT
ncbi:hypothetical protein TIFTF001_031075 [Ficus carica]|uniref:Uncharacterized protein n=1 Tax=Ficus carica TaxID=3494 RepID=A0AA88DUS0_FICCA|nr:hypothetical protein TIFTF001_031075 [Ficus carica]